MGSKRAISYFSEFKEQMLTECIETNKYDVVARKHNFPATVVYTWIKRDKNKTGRPVSLAPQYFMYFRNVPYFTLFRDRIFNDAPNQEKCSDQLRIPLFR